MKLGPNYAWHTYAVLDIGVGTIVLAGYEFYN